MTNSPPHRPWFLPAWSWLGWFAVFALLALCLVRLPQAALVEPGEAYEMSIDVALRHGLPLGDALLTEAGPLAGLASGHHSGAPLWPQFWWQFVFGAALAGVLAWVLRGVTNGARGWLLAALVVAACHPSPALNYGAILLGGFLLVRGTGGIPVALGTGVMFGIFSLLNVDLAWLGIVAAAGGLALRGTPRRPAALAAAAGWLVGFGAGWLAAGQSLADAPAWLGQGLVVTHARSLLADDPWTTAVGWLGAGIALCQAGMIFARGQPQGIRGAALLAAALALLAWRHTVADPLGRPENFFCFAVVAAAGWAAFFPEAWATRPGRIFAGGFALLAGLGVFATNRAVFTESLATANRQVVMNAELLFDKPGWQTRLKAQFNTAAEAFALPRIRGEAGGQPVGVVGNAAGYALVNRLTFVPLPTVESYRAATPALVARDGAFLRGPRAPALVAQRLAAGGGELPAAQDAAAQLALYQGYEFLFEESGMLLWRRRANAEFPGGLRATEIAAEWGRPVALPSTAGRAGRLQINLHPTLAGRLREFVFPLMAPTIAFRDSSGSTVRHAWTRAMAGGFLVNPLFRGEIDLVRHQAGETPPVVTSFTVEAPPEVRRYFSDDITVTLTELPALPVTGRRESANALAARFAVSNRLPVAVAAFYPPQPVTDDGYPVLVVNPEGALEFALQPGDRRLTGQVGLMPGAYQGNNTTDGVEFIVEYLPADGAPQVLWRRLLEPLDHAGDRGRHPFDVALPAGAAGRLVLRTHNPPGHNQAWDWAYWTDLQFK